DPRDQGTAIGPVINPAAVERIRGLLEDAKTKGARVLAGGEIEGSVVQPTVLAGVTPEMKIYYEESFGPIACLVEVGDADEAVEVANDTDYGLAAAVFSNDVDAAMAIARRIESGICHINGSTVHDEPQMPFGGVKGSGWGRFGGTAALVVPLHEEAVDVELVEERLGDEVVAALGHPRRAEVAAAHVRGDRHALGAAAERLVDVADVDLVLVLGIAADLADVLALFGIVQ